MILLFEIMFCNLNYFVVLYFILYIFFIVEVFFNLLLYLFCCVIIVILVGLVCLFFRVYFFKIWLIL